MARMVRTWHLALAVTAALGAAADRASAQVSQTPPPASGRHIPAQNGDTVVVENDDYITVVRQRAARVRVVADEAQKTLILLADWALPGSTEPDGRLNRTWRFSGIEGRWPFEPRWEGLVTMRFPDGPMMGPGPATATVPVMTLETAAGTIAFVSAAFRTDPPGVDVALRFSGLSGGGREGASFDEAEQEALSPTFMSSFSTMSLNGPGGGFISGGSGTWSTFAGGGPATQQVEARSFGTAPSNGMPRVVHRVEADWPPAARDAGVRGVVLVQVAVAADGIVRHAQVVRSIPMLNAAAIEAVRQWRFEAAGAEGRPDPLSITVPIVIPAPQR